MAWVLIVCIIGGGAALAQGLPSAAPWNVYQDFERYQSYKLDQYGEWSAYDLSSAQLLRSISSGSARSFMSSGSCIFYPQVRGNIPLGLTEVILNVCLIKAQPLKADSLSISAAGTRYDFLATPKNERIGSYACERFELPLDSQGMEMLRAIVQGGCSISIYAENKFYRTTVNEFISDPNAKQTLELSSIATIRSLLAQMEKSGLNDYALWDLNAAHWSANRAQMACVGLQDGVCMENYPALDTDFQCVATQDRTAVSALQQLLKENNFYSGKADGKYGAQTRAAIREAQRYWGLLQTGQADRILIQRLTTKEAPDLQRPQHTPEAVLCDSVVDAKPGVPYRAEGVAEVCLDRYWYAQALKPTGALAQANTPSTPTATPKPSTTSETIQADTLSVFPANSSNILLIIDGEYKNLAAQSIFLPINTQAEVVIDDQFVFPCILRSEQNEGRAFGTQILPLERSRIVLFTEIPHDVSGHPFAEIKLKIVTANGDMELGYHVA